jgi:rSAM/selenodomain-associated transferase 2
MKLSFIIPCWNDVGRLEPTLALLAGLEPKPEILVADASEEREPVRDLAARFSARYIEVAEPSRGRQMNAGALEASGDVLVFHHADTDFSQQHLDGLLAAMGNGGLVGGAFYKDIRAHHPKVGWSEPLVRLYSRYVGVLYGDQSVFVRRPHFNKIGGFREIPLMEDVDFSKRLRRSGKMTLIDPPIRTSMRRFKAEGTLWRKAQNVTLVLLFRIGVSPERLHRWYYRWKKPGRSAE